MSVAYGESGFTSTLNRASDSLLGSSQALPVDPEQKLRWRLGQWFGLFTAVAYPLYKRFWDKEQLVKGSTMVLWTLLGLTIFIIADRRVHCASVQRRL